MPTFRDPAARDRAWARYYSRKGLRGVVTSSDRPVPNPLRTVRYTAARAYHEAERAIAAAREAAFAATVRY